MATVNIYDMADTWNDGGTTFTAIKMDVTDTASAAGSLLMDLQVGSASKFSVDSAGTASAAGIAPISGTTMSIAANTAFVGASALGFDFNIYTGATSINNSRALMGNGFAAGSLYAYAFSSTTSASGTQDLYLTRKAAANLRLGLPDAGTVVPQTLSVQGGSGTNVAGQDFTIQGSQSTGSAAGGSILFQVSPAGSAGSGQNALETALTIGPNKILVAAPPPNENAPFVGIAADFGLGASGSFLTTIYSGTARALMGVDDGAATVKVQDSGFFGWSSTSTVSATYDVALWRDTANTLALRNGANAQAFNIYNTFTDASNYERGFMKWNSNVLEIGTEAAGSGTARSISLAVGSSRKVVIPTVGGWQLFSGATREGYYNWDAFTVRSDTYIGFASSTSVGEGSGDTTLIRVGSGILGVRANSTTTGGALNLLEQTAPSAPAANQVVIYAEDDGAGKTRLMALFPTGAAQQIAIEP